MSLQGPCAVENVLHLFLYQSHCVPAAPGTADRWHWPPTSWNHGETCFGAAPVNGQVTPCPPPVCLPALTESLRRHNLLAQLCLSSPEPASKYCGSYIFVPLWGIQRYSSGSQIVHLSCPYVVPSVVHPGTRLVTWGKLQSCYSRIIGDFAALSWLHI